jgi:4-hydroxy-3-polyprenylbenzoate decarboxylase
LRKIIVAITGASGAIYALKLLERLRGLPEPPAEVAVILTGNADGIMLYETGASYVPAGTEKLWSNSDFNAPFASGSSTYDTMIICPASMGMTGRIAHGVSDDLITRAADVMLKERRRLIVVPRETPYSLIHINNMKLLTLAGAIICPATPSFYSRPSTIDDLVMTVIDRVMSLAGFTVDTYRWNEDRQQE